MPASSRSRCLLPCVLSAHPMPCRQASGTTTRCPTATCCCSRWQPASQVGGQGAAGCCARWQCHVALAAPAPSTKPPSLAAWRVGGPPSRTLPRLQPENSVHEPQPQSQPPRPSVPTTHLPPPTPHPTHHPTTHHHPLPPTHLQPTRAPPTWPSAPFYSPSHPPHLPLIPPTCSRLGGRPRGHLPEPRGPGGLQLRLHALPAPHRGALPGAKVDFFWA